jgi:hypothetical protein
MELNRSLIVASLTLGIAVGTFVGVRLEADTQALNISRMTDRPYSRLIQRSPTMWLREVKNILGVPYEY